MNSQQLLLINFLIFTAVVLFFIFGRSKGKQPLKLNLRAPSSEPLKAPSLESVKEVKPESPPSGAPEVITEPSHESEPEPSVELSIKIAPVIITEVFQMPPAPEEVIATPAPVKSRSIDTVVPPPENSIFFVYNGHEWEAHEVLGLDKGCSLAAATARYQTLIKTSDSSTFEFYDAAYSALLKKLVST